MKALSGEPCASAFPLLAFLGSPDCWLISYRLQRRRREPNDFSSLPSAFLAQLAPILTTGNLRKNQPISQLVRGKQSYCSLLITLEVVNTSHSLSFKTTTDIAYCPLHPCEDSRKRLMFKSEAELSSELGGSWSLSQF